MSKNCELIKDLLPLYADEVCSDESRKAVEEHVKQCADCKAELEKLRKGVPVPQKSDGEVLRRIKRRLRIEKIVVALISFLVVIAVTIGGVIYMANSLVRMNYVSDNIVNNVSVEVEDNGDVVLISDVKNAEVIFTTLIDANGISFGEPDFDKEHIESIDVYMMKRRISSLFYVYGNDDTVRKTVCNLEKRPDLKSICYVDVNVNEKTAEKNIIWERDKNE